jgi:hypothetical protein
LQDRLCQQGLPRIEWAIRSPAPGEVALVVQGNNILVLAPGLQPEGIDPGEWKSVTGAGLPPSYGRRISYIGESPPRDISGMSVVLQAAPADRLPGIAGDVRLHSGGFLMNQQLPAGRSLRTATPPVAFAFLEEGRAGFVRFRLRPEQQGLLVDSAALPAAWEPARAQAFAAGVVWAVDRVLHRELPATAVDSEPTTLLTATDQQILAESGRRATDALALSIIGLCLLGLLWQAASWAQR